MPSRGQSIKTGSRFGNLCSPPPGGTRGCSRVFPSDFEVGDNIYLCCDVFLTNCAVLGTLKMHIGALADPNELPRAIEAAAW